MAVLNQLLVIWKSWIVIHPTSYTLSESEVIALFLTKRAEQISLAFDSLIIRLMRGAFVTEYTGMFVFKII